MRERERERERESLQESNNAAERKSYNKLTNNARVAKWAGNQTSTGLRAASLWATASSPELSECA